MTVFDNATHNAVFATSDKLSDLERLSLSDMVFSALKERGAFDDIVVAAAAPATPARDDKWLDTSTTPASLKVYDGAAWNAATFDTIWFRQNVTASATPPASPRLGDIWVDTDDGVTYEYLPDGTNDWWVDTSSPGFVPPGNFLPITGGALTGALSGTDGAFTGTVSGGTVASAGAVTAVGNVTAGGDVLGTNGTFTGTLSALSAAITGLISAATAVITGALTAGSVSSSSTVAANTAVTAGSDVTAANNVTATAGDVTAGTDVNAGQDVLAVRDVVSGGVVQSGSFTLATAPAAASYPGGIIFVTDIGVLGKPLYSDGVNWRRYSNNGIQI